MNKTTEEEEDEITSMMEWIFKTLETINTFRKDELEMFANFALHMVPNPRKIKRITMIYRAVRLLAKKKEEEENADDTILETNRKLLSWILLLEQWPVRMSWILQILEDDEQDEYVLKEKGEMTLGEFYTTYVEARVYDTALPHCSEALRGNYSKVLLTDGDPEMFDRLLKSSKCTLNDIGGFGTRTKSELNSFTLNLNPAIRVLLAQVAAKREDLVSLSTTAQTVYGSKSVKQLDEAKEWNVTRNKYSGEELLDWASKHVFMTEAEKITLENKVVEEGLDGGMLNKFLKNDHWEKSAQILELKPYLLVKIQSAWESRDKDNLVKVVQQKALQQKRSSANESSWDNDKSNEDDKKDDLQTDIHRSDNAVPSPLKKLAETCRRLNPLKVANTTTNNPIKDDKDHVGYLTYALVLAILVHKGVQPPCVFGLYAAWGTGKSFIMEKTISAI